MKYSVINRDYRFYRNWLNLIGTAFDGVNPAWIYDFLHYPEFLLLAAEENDRFAGTLCVKFVDDWIYLMFLAVEPDMRDCGIGSILMAKLKEIAKEKQAKGIIWEVLAEDNFSEGEGREDARRRKAFYARHGGRMLSSCYVKYWLPEIRLYLNYHVYYYLRGDYDPMEGARAICGDNMIIKAE